METGPEYAACDRLRVEAERGDESAASALEQVFYDFINDLGNPRRRAVASSALREEPRWLDLAARCRRGPCEVGACSLLDEMPSDVVADLVARHPLQAAPRTRTDPWDLLSHRSNPAELWEHLSTLSPVDGQLRALALDAALTKLAPLARNADRITERLRELGWPLRDLARRSADVPMYATPEASERGDVTTQISDLERIVGSRVPVTLEAFWRVVGAIDWSPADDEPLPRWAVDVGEERIDPLCIGGLDEAWYRVNEWSEDRARMRHPELARSPRAMIAPDRFHKMGISGGASYEVELDGSVDPNVLHAPEKLRLLPYIRNAMAWGGMPGMAYRILSRRARNALATLTEDLEPF